MGRDNVRTSLLDFDTVVTLRLGLVVRMAVLSPDNFGSVYGVIVKIPADFPAIVPCRCKKMTGDLLLGLKVISMMVGVILRLSQAGLNALVTAEARNVVLLLSSGWVWKLILLAPSIAWVNAEQVRVLLVANWLFIRMVVSLVVVVSVLVVTFSVLGYEVGISCLILLWITGRATWLLARQANLNWFPL